MSLATFATSSHIALVTDKTVPDEQLIAILSEIYPVRLLPLSTRPRVDTRTALCMVIDIDLAAIKAQQRIEHLSQLALNVMLPLIVVVDSRAEKPELERILKDAKALGATNYITRPFKPEAILRMLPRRSVFEQDVAQQDETTTLAVATAHGTLSFVVEALRSKRLFTFDDVMLKDDLIFEALQISGIKGWLKTVRRHHGRTYKHSLLVTGVAVTFSQSLGMHLDDQRRVAHAGLLHDVGKAFTPLSILDKPGKLTDDEMNEIKKHPVVGHELLVQQGGFPEEILDCVRHHHELLDGSGYPDRLAGDQIADLVRITTIADIFSALIEERPYKPALPPERALEIMQQMDGKLDADLLREFRPVALAVM